MNKSLLQRCAGPVALMLLVLMAATGCGGDGGKKVDSNVDYHTCTMHPSVKSKDPGKCPICSMDLVPVMKRDGGQAPPAEGTKSKDSDGSSKPEGKQDMAGMPGMDMGQQKGAEGQTAELNEFSVPVERQQQIGVTYAEAKRQPLSHTIRSVGSIVPDKGRRFGYVARVEGYVQKLEVTSPGELVEKDAPLLSIYSPDLLTTERELVNALQARDRAPSPAAKQSAQRLIDSASARLQQWNISEAQIAELERTRKPSESLTLNSPFKGMVEEVPVTQGRKVMVGDRLVELADLSVVWLWAQFYENELPMLKTGQKVMITSGSYPGEKFEGEVALIDPFLNRATRTGKVRIDIPNPDLKLRPGTYADVELSMDMGKGLTIPVSAIMPTGTRNLVFIERGEGKLEPRLVELGRKYGDFYEVKSGLEGGERVVSSANFLIDAESKVQGAVKMFEPAMQTAEPTGARPAPVLEQAAAPLPTPPPAAQNAMAMVMPLGVEARPIYDPLLEVYLAIQKQLANDQFDGVPDKATQLRQRSEALARADIRPSMDAEAYRGWVESFVQKTAKFQPKNIDEARVQFGELSWDLAALITQFPPPLERTLRTMHCPMWKKSPPCWMQVGAEVENPFMGPAMKGCGNEIKSLAEVK